ncbi:preprotein translocase subunit SecG [Candidatus Marinamargulisbacteria bacterium SCGC AAA071-K20]|nr:preprotein translocase subunit SecG [Candidatus Marinamargulisbacteria bacterium SCGC AAA071-K20]
MKVLLLGIEFLVSSILIISILLHAPKGEGMGAIGGSARLFNSSQGLDAGLSRFTKILAAMFMVIAIILGVFF